MNPSKVAVIPCKDLILKNLFIFWDVFPFNILLYLIILVVFVWPISKIILMLLIILTWCKPFCCWSYRKLQNCDNWRMAYWPFAKVLMMMSDINVNLCCCLWWRSPSEEVTGCFLHHVRIKIIISLLKIIMINTLFCCVDVNVIALWLCPCEIMFPVCPPTPVHD